MKNQRIDLRIQHMPPCQNSTIAKKGEPFNRFFLILKFIRDTEWITLLQEYKQIAKSKKKKYVFAMKMYGLY